MDVLIQQQEMLEAELAKAGAERDLHVASVTLAALCGQLRPSDYDAVRPTPAPRQNARALLPEEPLVLLEEGLSRLIPTFSRVPPGPTGVSAD